MQTTGKVPASPATLIPRASNLLCSQGKAKRSRKVEGRDTGKPECIMPHCQWQRQLSACLSELWQPSKNVLRHASVHLRLQHMVHGSWCDAPKRVAGCQCARAVPAAGMPAPARSRFCVKPATRCPQICSPSCDLLPSPAASFEFLGQSQTNPP